MVFQMKLYGLGGQGVVTASELLVHAAVIHERLYARSLPAYGHERRGAPVLADVMIDDQPILLNSFVYNPDCVLVFDPSVMDRGIDVGKGADGSTALFVNAGDRLALARLTRIAAWNVVYYVDATSIAIDALGSNMPNSAMLGAFATAGIVSLESICSALLETFGSSRGEANVMAARKAYSGIERV
jgi:pyruvate ferredoxin oxidoreductase gamma subunit